MRIEPIKESMFLAKPTSRTASFACYELPLVACMALIIGLSSRSALPGLGERGSLVRDIFNYSSHAAIYGILAILAWRVIVVRAAYLPGRLAAYPERTAILFALIYGILDESFQRFVPGRTASVWDVLADLIGASLAILIVSLWISYQTATRN